MSITEDFLGGHRRGAGHVTAAAEEQDRRGHKESAPQWDTAPATNSPDGHSACGAQRRSIAGGQTPQAGAMGYASPRVEPPRLADPLLALLADVLDDLERTRIANENRLRQLTRDEVDADGELRGLGLPMEMPQVVALAAIVSGIGKLEHEAELNLKRALRKHPLGPWIKVTNGIGEKQGARLLAVIGDPYWNTLYDRPRTVSELWAYCGLHVLPAAGHVRHESHEGTAGGGNQAHPGQSIRETQRRAAGVPDRGDPDHRAADFQGGNVGVAPTRTRGQRANWSATAKMRAFLVAESCVKTRTSPYRVIYDNGRAKYADAIHQADCRRCGPAGRPALAGTPLSLGHQHARALRLVMKALLKDLWIQAKAIHEGTSPKDSRGGNHV